MAIAIKPLEDRIVIKINEAEEKTASGLVIPDTAKEKPQEGTVVAVVRDVLMMESAFRWISKLAMSFFIASTAELKSSTVARNI